MKIKGVIGLFNRPKKRLEDMNLKELESEFSRVVKDVKFREMQIEDGVIILDPNDPNDREWYENDESYDYDSLIQK